MSPTLERIYYLDAMRAILMILGVVLHSAMVFHPSQSWLVNGRVNTDDMNTLVDIIHAFRMPAFFVVSGFFCAMTLRKYTPNRFIAFRMQRLLIPFLSTVLIINSLQMWDLATFENKAFELSRYLDEGEYVFHLWFLLNLMVYFVCAYLAVRLFRAPFEVLGRFLNKLSETLKIWGVLLLLPTLTLAIMMLNKLGFPLYFKWHGLIDMYAILIYFPYFLFGIFLYFNGDLLKQISQANPFIVFILWALAHFGLAYTAELSGSLFDIAKIYLSTLQTWLAVVLCFWVFKRFLSKPSVIMRALSDASYSVYLFHHVLVVIIGSWIGSQVNYAWLGFLVTLSCVLVSTLLIHFYVVKKSSLMLLLFNGR
jgi:glucans biosynthesis protein C